jgi:hypothetical protein
MKERLFTRIILTLVSAYVLFLVGIGEAAKAFRRMMP